jgi:uncharacterized protein (TIGR03435 family)
MHELDDIALLRQYSEQNSEEAFATLVTRHIDRVYSVALRHTGNPHSAEEITQAVFVILARKSSRLSKHVILEGWLYETARLTAMTFIRSEIRRARREQEAYMQNILNENEADVWPQIAPLLDSGLAGLNETDRHAVVLRFFYGKSMKEIGTVLGGSEDTARMRINRALEKLRKFFTKRGIASTTATLAGVISANSVQAAPVTLAKSVTAVAVVKGSIAAASTLTLVKGALNLMAWTKAKTAALIGTSLLVACGAAVYVWEVPTATFDVLNHTSPQVKIVPTKYPDSSGSGVGMGEQTLGISMSMKELIRRAYGLPDDLKLIISTKLPDGKYDYIANLSSGSEKALQQEITKQFGIVGHFEPHLKDSLVLKISDQSQLKVTPRKGGAGMWPEGKIFHWSGQPVFELTGWLEGFYKIPVIDETGMTNLEKFNFDLDWDYESHDGEKLKQALHEIGFELIPTNQPIEMLVVEKVK